MTSPLIEKIRRRIEQDGPISVADYMEIALSDPAYGYYATRDPLGARGDFVTAPEISQMFGEIVGLWAVHMWDVLGRPSPFALVELGPGRGTLMADMLRASRLAPGFAAAARVHLVEMSPALRARQRETLRNVSAPISWHDRLADIPAGPMILIANEFFDALPVHQFVRTKDGWRERAVGLGPAGRLAWQTAGTDAARAARLAEFRETGEDVIVEVSPRREAAAREIGARLAQSGGTALIVDYGHFGPAAGDTLQAVRGHAYADVLAQPGEADLTAHVDFSALCRVARQAGARAFGPVTQGEFLTALGLAVRAQRLKAARPDKEADIDTALARLTDPAEMGHLFKVAAFTGPDAPPPPPFAD